MKKSIILVLIFYLLQILGAGIIAGLNMLRGNGDAESMSLSVTIALLLTDIVMAAILLKMGYLSDKRLWNPTSLPFLLTTFVAGISAIIVCDAISALADFLPNLLEDTFSSMESSWWGIFAIVVVGPVLEEMLFRGAITSELLKHYSPKPAIILSALMFGVFHINPAQILTATLMGLLLAWLFYRTRSLIPGILIHILNNGLSVLFSQTNPEAKSFADILGYFPYFLCLTAALSLLYFSIQNLRRRT